MNKWIDRIDSAGDLLEQVFEDIIIGVLAVILVITAVHWIDGQMQTRLDVQTKPPIEASRGTK